MPHSSQRFFFNYTIYHYWDGQLSVPTSNTIENLWRILCTQICSMSRLNKFKLGILREWKKTDMTTLRNLVGSTSRRVQQVLVHKGNIISH